MSFVEPIEFNCPSCGKRRGNPRSALEDERGNFRSIVNCSVPKLCSDCRPLPRVHPFPGPLCASELDPAETIDRVVANFERPRTATIQGVPAPLHLPAEDIEETRLDLAPAHAAEADTIVVDVEVNAAGQIVISGAERV